MFKELMNPRNGQLNLYKDTRGELVLVNPSVSNINLLQLGKCYKKDTNETAFSSLLENIYVPGQNMIPPRDVGVPSNPEGKHAFILHPQNKS